MKNYYVMSDIHGDYEAYLKMKELIKFSPNDRMFILGDVIDRGKDGIKIIRDIMKSNNIEMLLGNHEWMMLHAYIDEDQGWADCWIEDNGGYWTMKELESSPDKREILEFVRRLKFAKGVRLPNGQVFLLQHAYPTNTVDERNIPQCLWKRIKMRDEIHVKGPNLSGNEIIIIGHTPVQYFDDISMSTIKEMCVNKIMPILRTSTYIDIDCGCGHHAYGANLACLNISTMQEYHVPI